MLGCNITWFSNSSEEVLEAQLRRIFLQPLRRSVAARKGYDASATISTRAEPGFAATRLADNVATRRLTNDGGPERVDGSRPSGV